MRTYMATTIQEKKPKSGLFHKQMSTEELVSWLREEGLGHKDCDIILDNGFTGTSFLLLEKNVVKELGIKMGGQIMITKLKKMAEEICAEVDDRLTFDTHSTVPNDDGRVVVPPASTLIINDIRESSPTGGTSTSGVQEMRDPQESPTRQQGEEDVTREPVSRVQSSGDGFREEDEAPVYCTQGLESGTSVFSFDHTVHMYRNKIWAGRELLKVTFLNPDVLNSWGLTRDNILDWAKVWDVENEKVPTFTCSKAKGDIRVKLSDTEGCWSAVGMDAEKIQPVTDPTMVLNLRGLPAHLQRSLVIHEFGHALGLDHEHQRSDFWDVMGGYFDKKRIPQEQYTRVVKKSDAVDKDRVLEYNPNSIMHYWFDLAWLENPRHRIHGNIEGDNTLSPTDKRYLLGVHKRQGEGKLPSDPSTIDKQYLVDIYVNDELRQVSSPVPRRKARQLSPATNTRPNTTTRAAPRNPQYNSIDKTDSVLQVNVHKQEILNTIWDVRAQWRVIGAYLGLSVGELDAIHANSSDYLNNVLVSWITQGNKYIEELLVVLRSSAVGRADLAEKIESLRIFKR